MAQAVGVSRSAWMNYKVRSDFPQAVPRRKPPRGWTAEHVQAVKAWSANLQPDRSGKHDDLAGEDGLSITKRIELLLKRERMLHTKLQREILEGRYVPREVMDEALGGLAGVFVAVLDELEITAPPRFAGKTAAQIAQEIQHILDLNRRRIVEKAQYELMSVQKVAESLLRRPGRAEAGK